MDEGPGFFSCKWISKRDPLEIFYSRDYATERTAPTRARVSRENSEFAGGLRAKIGGGLRRWLLFEENAPDSRGIPQAAAARLDAVAVQRCCNLFVVRALCAHRFLTLLAGLPRARRCQPAICPLLRIAFLSCLE